MIDIDYLKQNNLIIYEVISGSKAYGLDNIHSDTDIRGVFVLPEDEFYGFDYVDHVSDATNDTVYYEIKKFFSLLAKSNPTILEMLYTPEESVLQKSTSFPTIDMNKVLSKDCFNTFAKYAYSQIKKARGLNKKIVNPIEKARRSAIEFCTAIIDGKTTTLNSWAQDQEIDLSTCGLTAMSNCINLYALYWAGNDNPHQFKGVIKNEESSHVITSSIPKGLEPRIYISFNIDGYKTYCKDYKEYWNWVEKRNDTRFAQTMEHGKKYDAKNMMHTFRLLAIADEIVHKKTLHVKRPDKDYLLAIKAGAYEYDNLLDKAEQQIDQLKAAYENSSLPNTPDSDYLENVLINIRKHFYADKNEFNQHKESGRDMSHIRHENSI